MNMYYFRFIARRAECCLLQLWQGLDTLYPIWYLVVYLVSYSYHMVPGTMWYHVVPVYLFLPCLAAELQQNPCPHRRILALQQQ